MWSVEVVVHDPSEFLGFEGFSTVGREDLDVRTVCERDPEGKATANRMEWEALTPRGALFLGELASVGFFGPEAQQLLTF